MTKKSEVVVVLGSTGQQGGATARALAEDGWHVRALVRDPSSPKAQALSASGIDVVRGDFRERTSLAAGLAGAYGVFSVQPSSGQPEYGVTDEDEVRFGIDVANAAQAAGVAHLIYTSVAGAAPQTGVGHFESKWRIEEHIRALGLRSTILRPAAFMEILLLPHFGLAQGTLMFFAAPDRPMQFIAVEDIGKLAARVFAQPEVYGGKTLEIAGDAVTGNDLADKIGRATKRTLRYTRFPPAVLRQNDVLRRLVELVDEVGAMGTADLNALRQLHPGLLTFDAWLARTGALAIERRLFDREAAGQAG